MEKGSLTRVNSFNDEITYQSVIKVSILIAYKEFMVLWYIYQTYHRIRLILNDKCTVPVKDDQGHSENFISVII